MSQPPAYTRQWLSCYKALDEVSYDQDPFDDLCLPEIPTHQVAHFALDLTSLRPSLSPTFKDRLYGQRAKPEVGGHGIILALPYAIFAGATPRGSSFAPGVHIGRLKPLHKAVAVALEQVLWLGFYTLSHFDWRVALDGAYGTREFFDDLQDKALQVVARTPKDRVFYRRAVASADAARGRLALFGEVFGCNHAHTWGAADFTLTLISGIVDYLPPSESLQGLR